jgi:hypothetical protein
MNADELAKALAAAMRHPSPDHTNYAEVEAANALRISTALRDVERETVERIAKLVEGGDSAMAGYIRRGIGNG